MLRKRLLFFINSLACGGAEKVLVNLLNSLDKKYEIDLLVIQDGMNAKDLGQNIRYRYIVTQGNGVVNRLKKLLICHLPYALFSKWFIKGEYDCEIACLEGFPTRIIASRKNKSNKIAIVHCNLTFEMISGLYKNPSKVYKEYAKFNHVVFVSESAKRIFENTYGKLDNAKVLQNIMDINHIKKLALQSCPAKYQTTGVKLISIGRLEAVKGFERLFDIVLRLEQKYHFELWVLGDGTQRKSLEDKIKERRIRSIKMQGYQTNPYSFLRQADIYVCSSYTEGYSTVVKESLICGVPIVTTNCGGMHEIIVDGKNGYIVDNSDTALEKGLEKILADRLFLQKLKDGALQYMEKYNIDKNIEEYERLLEDNDNV